MLFSLVDTLKLARLVGSREPTHRDVGNKPYPAPGGSRRTVGRWLFMYDTLAKVCGCHLVFFSCSLTSVD